VSAWGSKFKSVRQDEVKWERAQKYSWGKLSEDKNAVERRSEERTPEASLEGYDEVNGGSPSNPPRNWKWVTEETQTRRTGSG
jgi:hypothetical protein